MNTLIKAVEVWLPTPDRSLLEFGGGLFGAATGFGASSRTMCFGRGEGLPRSEFRESRVRMSAPAGRRFTVPDEVDHGRNARECWCFPGLARFEASRVCG